MQGYTRRHSHHTKAAAQEQASGLKKHYKSVRVVKETGVWVNDVKYTVFTKGSKK